MAGWLGEAALCPPKFGVAGDRGLHGHIPELDGLRALGVLPVISYHFGFGGNGPAGVTIFFALSGYIVTSVLLGEFHSSRRISLGEFYLRRARRLLPAATTAVVATAVVGWILEKPPIRREAFAALTYWSNFERATSSVPYGSTEYAPLEHFWSLAIEEQFYLVLPLVLAVLLRRHWAWSTAVLAILTLSSAWFALTSGNPQNYFHPGARMCELLVGVLLALLGLRLPAMVGYLALASLLAIVTGVLEPAPVVTAVITCAAIAALPRVLAMSPLVAVGRYSYGLYLWHPLAAIVTERWNDRLALTVVLAAASYHLIEHPIRHSVSQRQALIAVAALTACGLGVVVAPFSSVEPLFVEAVPAERLVFVDEKPPELGRLPETESTELPPPQSALGEQPVGLSQKETVVARTESAVESTPPTTTTPPPIRISGAGDSTQMFADHAWQVLAYANPDLISWVLPPPAMIPWTSGADSWIRNNSRQAGLSLVSDGPQGGLDRQGCPLIHDVRVRALPEYPFAHPAERSGGVPIKSCDWRLWISASLAEMDLDVLVVSWAVTAMWEYEMPDGSEGIVGAPGFDQLLADRMTEFEVMAAAHGTKVLWLTYSPIPEEEVPPRWMSPEAADAFAAVAIGRNCWADLRPLIRGDSTFGWYQDGYHFTEEGAARAVAHVASSLPSCMSTGS